MTELCVERICNRSTLAMKPAKRLVSLSVETQSLHLHIICRSPHPLATRRFGRDAAAHLQTPVRKSSVSVNQESRIPMSSFHPLISYICWGHPIG